MRRLRNVKIVATLGPASNDYDTIRALHEAGADVFRLNMSHGSHDEIRERHRIIRQVEKDLESPIAILADLQGPKLRVGVNSPMTPKNCTEGARASGWTLITAPGDGGRVCLPHPEIFAALEPGARLLVNDGKIRLIVEECGQGIRQLHGRGRRHDIEPEGCKRPRCGSSIGRSVSQRSRRSGVCLPTGCRLAGTELCTTRTKMYIEARSLADGRASILSKIEKPAAVEAFDDILDASDGIMVARGDLGVELPVSAVPPIQKRLVRRRCRAAAKPVIVATQMLESMIESPMPTRAPRSRTWPPPYMRALTQSCSARNRRPVIVSRSKLCKP